MLLLLYDDILKLEWKEIIKVSYEGIKTNKWREVRKRAVFQCYRKLNKLAYGKNIKNILNI